VVAIFLAQESRGLLVGERASHALTEAFTRIVEADEAVDEVETTRTMHLGPDHVLLNAEVRFKPGRNDLPAVIGRIKERLAQSDPLLSDVTIEPAPETAD